MTKVAGAGLLIFACGGMGVLFVRDLHRGLQAAEDMYRITERMQTQICVLHRSLPEVLSQLSREYPSYFSGMEDISEALMDRPFAELWQEHIRVLSLPADADAAMCALGCGLSEGEPPEKTFRACLEQLSSGREELSARLNRNGKVYIAFGFAAGCMLTIAAI